MAASFTNQVWPVDMTIRILLIELETVTPVPVALGRVVFSTMAVAIANIRLINNMTVRKSITKAVSSVPTTLRGVVLSSMAVTIAN